MKHVLLVFLGGGLGSALRYGFGKWLNPIMNGFPLGTFSVNVLGSFIIGLILGLSLKQNSFSETTVILIATGFCGGFTTFSAFAFENYELLKNGDFLNFGLYTLASLLLGILAVFLGIWLVKII